MTDVAQRKQVPKPPSRLPVPAPVLWTGLALGTFLAVEALERGIRLPVFTRGPIRFLDTLVTFALFLLAGVVLMELTRRHHRTVARHGWRHGKRAAIASARHGSRGASAAYRGARRHGARGAAFAGTRAKSKWASGWVRWRQAIGQEPETQDDPPLLSEEWDVPPAPAPQSPNPTGGKTMTTNGTRQQPRTRHPAAGNGVPGAWGAVVAHATDFQAESDGDLLSWMRGEAIGAAAYAEALVEQYEVCRDVIGVDPVAIQTLHDVADAATTMAATMAAAVKRFAEHYELPTQFVSDGGLLAHDGRWHKGDDG